VPKGAKRGRCCPSSSPSRMRIAQQDCMACPSCPIVCRSPRPVRRTPARRLPVLSGEGGNIRHVVLIGDARMEEESAR